MFRSRRLGGTMHALPFDRARMRDVCRLHMLAGGEEFARAIERERERERGRERERERKGGRIIG